MKNVNVEPTIFEFTHVWVNQNPTIFMMMLVAITLSFSFYLSKKI